MMRILIFLFFAFFTIKAPAAMHVVIDPGHGGVDTGATNSITRESDLTLKVGQILDQLLKKDPRFESTLTRNRDQNLTLKERTDLADKSKADLFLSIHANASPDKRAKGVELYFQNSLPPSEESLSLAFNEEKIEQNDPHLEMGSADVASIVEDLKKQNKIHNSFSLSQKLKEAWLQSKSPSIKQAPFYVISESKIPSVLVEIGFLTNTKEAQSLINRSYQNEIAEKIYHGLIGYKEMIDKISQPRLH